ncbi:MAG: hypothetical protein FJ276_23675 [Planctomycetes bacterium]|nr:hypothetical protein [Planctomycetota bacterium]
MAGPVCLSDEELFPVAVGERVSDEVSQHVASCEVCRDRVHQLESEVSQLRDTFGDFLSTGRWHELVDREPRTVEVTESAIPDSIGRYRVIGLLGAGGQAIVYRAAHPNLPVELVVKVARRASSDAASRQRTMEEGRIIAQLDHPYLARVYDLDFDNGRPFLVMEYVRGRNLQDHASGKSLEPREAARIVADVARALATAHSRGIVHLDVKPGNIVVDETGRPRLIDFGMAHFREACVADEAAAKSAGGTPAFIAPEQARGEATDARSDVFSLGATLYALLVGKPPYAGTTVGEMIERARRGNWDPAALESRNIPAGLKRVCHRAMQLNPADRYADAGAMAEALDRMLRVSRRRLIAGVSAAVGGIALLMLLGWALWPTTPAFVGEIEFQVRLRNERSSPWQTLGEVVSVRTGDFIQVYGRIPHDRHATLFAFGTSGSLRELPLKRLNSRGAVELYFPDAETSSRIEGDPGTEVLLLCIGARPVSCEDLADLFGDEPWPDLWSSFFLTIDPQRVDRVYRDEAERPQHILGFSTLLAILPGVSPQEFGSPEITTQGPEPGELPPEDFRQQDIADPDMDIARPDVGEPPFLHDQDAWERADRLRRELLDRVEDFRGVVFQHRPAETE